MPKKLNKATPLRGHPPRKVDVAEIFRLRYKHNFSYDQIAARTGSCKSSVHAALKTFIGLLPNPEEIEAYRQNKAAILEGAELVLLKAVMDTDKLKEASTNNAAYALQQVATQARLTRGEATMIVDVRASEEEIRQIDAEIRGLGG